jgi:hypothetical protein
MNTGFLFEEDLTRRGVFGQRASVLERQPVAVLELGDIARPTFGSPSSKARTCPPTSKPRGIFHLAFKIGCSFIETALAARWFLSGRKPVTDRRSDRTQSSLIVLIRQVSGCGKTH